MSDQPIDVEGATNAKNPKLGEPVQNQAAIEMAVVEAEDPPPQIFKLNIDCYEAVADWLSLKDLHSFGQTCTRHQQAAGYIFKEVYPAAGVHCKENGIYIGDVQVNGFCDYIQQLFIGRNDCYRFIESHSFALLKRIHLDGIDLTDEKIRCIKKILKKVELVELNGCEVDGEFHDKFLQFCESLKRLTVWPNYIHPSKRPGVVIGTSNDWLLREYPKIEHFEMSDVTTTTNELKMFLQRNPNIRHFANDVAQLWTGADDVRTEFDVLAIKCDDDVLEWTDMDTVLQDYSELDETKRFFKRLHIYSLDTMTQSRLERLNSLNQIEKLHMYGALIGSLSLNNLKEIHVQCSDDIDLESAIVNGHPNLERVSLSEARFVDILAFIRGSPKMTKLRIERFHRTVRDNGWIIDLSAWNDQRATLNRARKVAIYVEEKVFLATKWAKHTTEYRLVGLQRHQSHYWDHDMLLY